MRLPLLSLLPVLLSCSVASHGAGSADRRAPDLEQQHPPMFLHRHLQVDDVLYAGAIIYLSPIMADPQSGALVRIVAGSINWQCGVDLVATSFFHLEPDPMSAEALELDATIAFSSVTPAPPQHGIAGQYGATIAPRAGLTWGQVARRADLTFEVTLLEAR